MENIQRHNIVHEELDLYGKVSAAGRYLHYRRGEKPTQERILHIIHRHDGSINQRELQDILRIRQGSISEIVCKMEDKGLIVRSQDEADRRKVKLRLTEEGEALRQEKCRQNRAEDTHLFDVLQEKEEKQLNELLDKLLAAWYGEQEKGNI